MGLTTLPRCDTEQRGTWKPVPPLIRPSPGLPREASRTPPTQRAEPSRMPMDGHDYGEVRDSPDEAQLARLDDLVAQMVRAKGDGDTKTYDELAQHAVPDFIVCVSGVWEHTTPVKSRT